MSAPLVHKLRTYARRASYFQIHDLLLQAADEIERLAKQRSEAIDEALVMRAKVDSLEAEREKARKAWAECRAHVEHYFRCDAPHDATFEDARCDCGLRDLQAALS